MKAPNMIQTPGDPDQNYTAWTESEKGGGFRGAPRRWTGKGPRPARHIPWPEVFKHHLSVLEGHFKMLDMIRKHTIEGTGNHRAIMGYLERTQAAIRQTKDTHRSFVPPAGLSEAVPIGSSSASMYPGYSPADIIYGEPARELGEQWGEARAKSGGGGSLVLGADDGPQYELCQSKGAKKVKKTIAQIRAEQEALGDPAALSRPPRMDEQPATRAASTAKAAPNESAPNGTAHVAAVSNGDSAEAENGGNPYFMVDTTPMDVQLPTMEPPTVGQKSKKRKRKSDAQAEDADVPAKNGAKANKSDHTGKSSKKEKRNQKAEAAQTAVEVLQGLSQAEMSTTWPKKEKRTKRVEKTAAKGGKTVEVSQDDDQPLLSTDLPGKEDEPKQSTANGETAESTAIPSKKGKKVKKSSMATEATAPVSFLIPDTTPATNAPSTEIDKSKKLKGKKSKSDVQRGEATAPTEDAGKSKRKKKDKKTA